jgi:hypothetical protein
VNQPKARLPPNQSPATLTGRRFQMASNGNECAGIPPVAIGTKRTCQRRGLMSAFGGKADMNFDKADIDQVLLADLDI